MAALSRPLSWLSKTPAKVSLRKCRRDCSIHFSRPRKAALASAWLSQRESSKSMEACSVTRLNLTKVRPLKSSSPKCNKMQPNILLIEDDQSTASALEKVLRADGYTVNVSPRGDDGLAQARNQSYDLVITDLKLPGLTGLDLIAELHSAKPKLPIIMMTAHGTTETAIEAMKLGACDYLVKPFEADELLALTASAVASSRLMSEPIEIGEAHSGPRAIIGKSRVMQNIYKEIGRIAATSITVLIRGATGTGKELIARAIYQHSDRAD